MKVFISWSGERSKAVAEALDDWLPKVIQAVRPFVSTNSIDKGTRWRDVLSNELEQSRFSIICLTPENLVAPWILFEAGALSKGQQDSVCTYLFGLDSTDVSDPLSQFQATKADKSETKELARIINRSCGDSSLSETDFDETFEVWWPRLERKLLSIPEPQIVKDPKRSDRELLEDILTSLRAMQLDRDLRNKENDNVLLQYLQLLKTAGEADPNLRANPEFQNTIEAIERKLKPPSLLTTYMFSKIRKVPVSAFGEFASSLQRANKSRTKEEESNPEGNSPSENSNP